MEDIVFRCAPVFTGVMGIFTEKGLYHPKEMRLFESINVFLFEDHPDPVGFQYPRHLQAVYCVPGEPGEGLSQDHVDAAPFAGGNHPVELLPFFMLVPVIPSSAKIPAISQSGFS